MGRSAVDVGLYGDWGGWGAAASRADSLVLNASVPSFAHWARESFVGVLHAKRDINAMRG